MATFCMNGFIWNGATNLCEVAVSNGLILVDTSSDIGGGVTNDFMTNSTCGPQTAGQWGYSYFGDLIGTQVITFNNARGVTAPHYQIEIIFWAILIDVWSNAHNIIVTLNGN